MLKKPKIKSVKALRKAQEKRLDKLWSTRIKELAGWKCEACGKMGVGFNSHHIYSRRFNKIRWTYENGLCLCVGCHFKAHQESLTFIDIVKNIKGEEVIQWLITRKGAKTKIDLNLIEMYLKKEI